MHRHRRSFRIEWGRIDTILANNAAKKEADSILHKSALF